MQKIFITIASFLLLFPLLLLAQETVQPELGESVLGLFDALKGGFMPATFIVALTQLLRTKFLGKILNKVHSGIIPLVVLLLGFVSQLLLDISSGRSFVESLVQGLFNGGFAILLYDVFLKHFVKKKAL